MSRSQTTLQAVLVKVPVAIPDCGEAGHDDGCCGNSQCLPSRNKAQLAELGLTWQRLEALEAEIETLKIDWKKSLAEVEALKSRRTGVTSNFDVLIQWMGSALGIMGALLLALNTPWSAYGWISFLLSNFAWILFAYRKQLWSMLVMQMVFTGTSVLGIYQWILMA